MKEKLEKFGPLGTVIAAAACPVCFPKLALLGAFFGLGAFAEFEGAFFIVAQLLVLAMLAGYVIYYRRNGNRGLLVLVVLSTLLFFISLYVLGNEYVSYGALLGFFAASIWLVVDSRRRCGLPAS